MIRYRLICGHAHEFDEWFDSMADYDVRKGEGAIACPDCGDTQVSKTIMAPRLAGAGDGSMGQVRTRKDPSPTCGAGGDVGGCGSCPSMAS
jgi:hypothetical protein